MVEERENGENNELQAMLAGFSLHAGLRALAHVRDKLERLCRYISRPLIVMNRLSLMTSGHSCVIMAHYKK